MQKGQLANKQKNLHEYKNSQKQSKIKMNTRKSNKQTNKNNKCVYLYVLFNNYDKNRHAGKKVMSKLAKKGSEFGTKLGNWLKDTRKIKTRK